MTALSLTNFSGEIPKLLPRLLPDNAAQISFNSRLQGGDLTPTRKSRFTYSFSQLPANGFGTLFKYNNKWLAWQGVVNAVRGPVAQERLYITGNGKPQMVIGPLTYDLAVIGPVQACTAALSGGATDTTITTRAYVYTNVTAYGEESEPCPLSNEVDWQPGKIVTLSNISTNVGTNRNATKQRFYRTTTSTTGVTTLYFIKERNASTADFVDDVDVADFAEPLPSADFNPPPDDLSGLISLPNGMMAAFVGKDLYLCEPFIPHAWPEKYILTTEYSIVGLGSYGNTIVVMTEGNPYIVNGSTPDAMIMEKLELNLPCINARGIVDLGYAVAYPSHDGLVTVTQGGARIVTEELLARDNWLLLNPQTMVASQRDGRYFASYSYIDTVGITQEGTLILDMSGTVPYLLRSQMRADAFYYDIFTGSLFFIRGLEVFEYDAIGEQNDTQVWRSKEFILPRPTNFGAIKVDAEDAITDEELAAIEQAAEQILAENQALYDIGDLGGDLAGAAICVYEVNGDVLEPIPSASRYVAVNIFADDELIFTIGTINKIARLPSGFKAEKWEFEVASDTRIAQIRVATTARELMQV